MAERCDLRRDAPGDVSREDVLAALATPAMDDGAAAAQRRAYRAWIKANHPDAGGDPETFDRALRAYREASRAAAGRPEDPRFTAPVVFTHRRRLRDAALQWLRRRRAPTRVH